MDVCIAYAHVHPELDSGTITMPHAGMMLSQQPGRVECVRQTPSVLDASNGYMRGLWPRP
jgi:hypothetical protein